MIKKFKEGKILNKMLVLHFMVLVNMVKRIIVKEVKDKQAKVFA